MDLIEAYIQFLLPHLITGGKWTPGFTSRPPKIATFNVKVIEQEKRYIVSEIEFTCNEIKHVQKFTTYFSTKFTPEKIIGDYHKQCVDIMNQFI